VIFVNGCITHISVLTLTLNGSSYAMVTKGYGLMSIWVLGIEGRELRFVSKIPSNSPLKSETSLLQPASDASSRGTGLSIHDLAGCMRVGGVHKLQC
jgi:hypothetical protein